MFSKLLSRCGGFVKLSKLLTKMLRTELVCLTLIVIRAAAGQLPCIPTDQCIANILTRLETLERLIGLFGYNTQMAPRTKLIEATTKMPDQGCPCMRDKDKTDVCQKCGSDLCNKMTYAAMMGEKKDGNDSLLCITGVVGKDRWNNDYTEMVEGGMQEGSVILLRAYVESGERFSINIKTRNESWASDTAFHFNPRKSESILVMNTQEKGSWQSEERLDLADFIPYIFQKRPFEIKITISSTGFQVYGNTKKLCFFSHRVDVSRLASLHIVGDVHVYHDKVMKPVPPMTMHEITMSNINNVWVLIQMTLHQDDDRIQIFFCEDNRTTSNIHLAFSPRMREKVTIRNSFEKGAWKVEEREQPEFPFVVNESAEVAFLFQPYNIKIYVDRKYYVDFQPRLPISLIHYVYLKGATFYKPEVYYSTPKF